MNFFAIIVLQNLNLQEFYNLIFNTRNFIAFFIKKH
ncbi:hypothetical protein CUP0806 [Campylobacter upsaliensis RM3195]|nr:hypothetical protein CUP0806 [Campylobacter upsaliensis RM3195]